MEHRRRCNWKHLGLEQLHFAISIDPFPISTTGPAHAPAEGIKEIPQGNKVPALFFQAYMSLFVRAWIMKAWKILICLQWQLEAVTKTAGNRVFIHKGAKKEPFLSIIFYIIEHWSCSHVLNWAASLITREFLAIFNVNGSEKSILTDESSNLYRR